jgi:DNA adenine methylase
MAFRYIGGKYVQAKWISGHIENIHWKRYTEVFGGAMWIYLRSDIAADEIYYNDFNPFLVNVWTFLTQYRDKLLKSLKGFKLNDKETFHSIKRFIKNKEKKGFKVPDVEIASKYIYLLTHVFSGDISGGMKLTDNGWQPFLNKLHDKYYLTKFDKIDKIYNESYEDLMPMLDIEDGFFYVDPPYYGKEHLYGFHSFGLDDHYKLADILKNSKSYWILSYYDYDDLGDLYPKSDFVWESKEFSRSSSAVPGKPGKGEEIIIYPLKLVEKKNERINTFFV